MSWRASAVVGFWLDGERFRLHPGIAGMDLAAAAAAGQWSFLVPDGLVRADRVRLVRRLADPDDELDLPHVYALALTMAQQVFGVPWHVAQRLCGIAESDWTTFHGWSVTHGVTDPRALSGEAVCAVVWAWLVDRMAWAEADKQRQLRDQVWGPPDNQLALIEAGVHMPVSEHDRRRQQEELASWGLPEPDSPNATAYPES